MVVPSHLRRSIDAAIESIEPDGRYMLDDDGFRTSWLASPDVGEEMVPRDLLSRSRLRDVTLGQDLYAYTVSITVMVAAYNGIRTSVGSLLDITAEDRIHGAAAHLAEELPELDLGGPMMVFVGYDDPFILDDIWLATDLTFTLLVPRT